VTFAAVSPWLFVLVWSTGFIATKIGLRDCPPLTLLTLRFGGAALVLIAVAIWMRARWPADIRTWGHLIVTGLLTHALYLGFSFEANAMGMPVSVLALIGALQPVLTVLGAGWLLRERVAPRQWAGLALGFAGVVLVLFDRVAFEPSPVMIGCAFISILGITAGTLYQKRNCGEVDLLAGTAVQFVAAALAMAFASALFETPDIRWRPGFAAALAWLTVVNSVVSVNLLYWLIKRGAAARVTSLFYLVPLVTSIMAYFMVDERFGRYFLIGATVTMIGVALAMRAPRPASGR